MIATNVFPYFKKGLYITSRRIFFALSLPISNSTNNKNNLSNIGYIAYLDYFFKKICSTDTFIFQHT